MEGQETSTFFSIDGQKLMGDGQSHISIVFKRPLTTDQSINQRDGECSAHTHIRAVNDVVYKHEELKASTKESVF